MAPVRCKTTRTIYYPAPKNASTTLRTVYFEIENGFPFRNFSINGQNVTLFSLFRHVERFKKVPIPTDYEVLTVVRDPIQRFLSFYKWAVIDNNGEFTQTIEINDFVADFETLLTHSGKVRWHLLPQWVFTGKDLSFYHHIFRAERMDVLQSYLSERANRHIALPHVNSSSGPKENTLTPKSRAKLRDIYREDYALLRDFYTPDLTSH